jgi:hypothetical protein
MPTLTFDLDGALRVAIVGVRRASSFMALGLRVAADDTIRSVKLETNLQIQFMPDPLSEAQSAAVRSEFAKWVIANGLRELDQHFHHYADAIYPALVATKAGGTFPDDIDRLATKWSDETNLGNKLRRLVDEFGIAVAWRTQIASMSNARNAITHNLGRVGPRHRNDGNTLRLSWRGMDLVAGDTVISAPFEPFVVEGGTKVSIRYGERVKVFQLGQVVDLSAHDLNEICLMFQFQASEIHKGVLEYARANKVPIDDKSKKTQPAADLASEL